jgi:DNA repair protein RecN (Recombination protein N)
MLKSLNIINFAVIERLSVSFQPGLNVLTGETGSGKSIIVDALSLLVGGRSSSVQIRTGETRALVEGVFHFGAEREQSIKKILGEIGLETNFDLIIRREIYSAGRSRSFINDSSVTTVVLKKLQPFLSEIYGQGEQRSLLSAQAHRDLLDHYGECAALKSKVKQIYLRLKTTERELRSLDRDTAERERSQDFMQHQLAEIEAINPSVGEDEDLLNERRILAQAERIVEICSKAYYDLYERDESVLARLALIRREIEDLSSIIGSANATLESLLSGIASLADAADALRDYGTGLEYSPARLSQVESRLAELERLKRKYGRDLDGIVKLKDEMARDLSKASEIDELASTLGKQLEVLRRDYIESARRLTACRRAAAPKLEQKIMNGLRQVAMGQAKFLVSIETSSLEDEEKTEESFESETAGEDSGSAFFTPEGADYVEFLLSANPGEGPRPLSYVASGGELSRLMLTLRAAGKEDKAIETIVFDEIDVGIGGRVAEVVGQRLKNLAASRQVFCVTHQAQIAKFADHHFIVTKVVESERASTKIRELTREERISELSRMIGGDEKAAKTREAAQWLLENAQNSRKGRTKESR